MKDTGRENGKACRGRGWHFAKKSKGKRFGMKLKVEERYFIHWFHNLKIPAWALQKYSWFMPVSAVHMCLEYLINSTDLALCLLGEGLRDGGGEGKREWERDTDKKWGMESTNRKAMDGMKGRTKKKAKRQRNQGRRGYVHRLTIEWEMLKRRQTNDEREWMKGR